jgi:hypothetical protein
MYYFTEPIRVESMFRTLFGFKVELFSPNEGPTKNHFVVKILHEGLGVKSDSKPKLNW